MKEHFLALGSANKAETTVTDDSLDSPLHGTLGQRAEIFALDREIQPGGLRVKSPHALLAQPYHHRSGLSKEKLRASDFDES